MRIDHVARTSTPRPGVGTDPLEDFLQADFRASGGSMLAPMPTSSTASPPFEQVRNLGFSVPRAETVMVTLTRGKAFAFSAIDRAQSALGMAWEVSQRIMDAKLEKPSFMQRPIDGLGNLLSRIYLAKNTAAQVVTTEPPIPPAPSNEPLKSLPRV